MDFIKRLKQEQKKFETEKYHKKAMPEVMEYLKQYRAENGRTAEQTVYNSELEEFITKKEGVSSEMVNYLGTEVYLAQGQFRNELKDEHKNKMLADGWLELTREVEYRGKILLDGKKEGMIGTAHLEKIAKIITSGDGQPFIIPKGLRSRGWYVSSLEQAFYKPVK